MGLCESADTVGLLWAIAHYADAKSVAATG